MRLSILILLLALGDASAQTARPGVSELPAVTASHPFPIVSGVSVQGSRVAGVASPPDSAFWETPPPGLDPFVWSPAGGYRRIELPDSLLDIGAEVSISDDGETVVGLVVYQTPARMLDRAFRWTEAEGFTWLPTPAGSQSRARAVSSDGAYAVGEVWSPGSAHRTVRWNPDGTQTEIPPPEGFGDLRPRDISGDGRAVVGVAYRDGVSFARTAFRWTEAGGTQILESVAERFEHSEPYAISADGRAVVGYAYNGGISELINAEAFLWREGHELAVLGTWTARDVSADGSVVVGRQLRSAVVWTEADGARYLDAVVEPGRLKLTDATAVSADGSVVVGIGETPDGERTSWWTRLPSADDR